MPIAIYGLLIAAGAALVVQNLIMARISGQVSSVLVALVLNSGVGLFVLSGLLFDRFGIAGVTEVLKQLRPWAILPGLLGTFFVFASLLGYQRIGAAATISVLVASQLVAGLAWDMMRSGDTDLQSWIPALFGCALLIAGAVLVAARGV